MRVERPADPATPTPIFKAPGTVGPCDGVTLDAAASYGSMGRALKFYFGMQPGATNDQQVRSLRILTLLTLSPCQFAPSNFRRGGQNYPVKYGRGGRIVAETKSRGTEIEIGVELPDKECRHTLKHMLPYANFQWLSPVAGALVPPIGPLDHRNHSAGRPPAIARGRSTKSSR